MPGLQDILRLLQSSGGMPAGFSQDYAAQGENAYQLLAQQLAALDRSEVATNTGYENQRAELGYQNQDATRSLLNAMANRGTLKSGITTRALQNQGRQYTSLLDQLASGKQSQLADYATQRLNAQGGYNQTMASLNNAYAGKSSEYIAQQVAAQAQREQQQQQMLFQDQLTKQNQMFQQQMLNAMNTTPNYSITLPTGTTNPSGTTLGQATPNTLPPKTASAPITAPSTPKPTGIQAQPSVPGSNKPRYLSGGKAPYAV